MDFLKKHYEKITLAAALILLIVSAVLLALKVSALSTEIDAGARRAPKPQLAAHIALQVYSNAIQAVTDPPLWNTNEDLKAFSPTNYVAPKLITIDPGATNGLPILLAVVHKPFTLLFKTYSSMTTPRQRAIISNSIFSTGRIRSLSNRWETPSKTGMAPAKRLERTPVTKS